MSTCHTSMPQVYEIKVKGHLPPDWADWFDGMTLHTDTESAETTLRGAVVDQAALYGVLVKVRDLGLPLLSVNPVQPDRSTT
ncbi:MAG TPA: hypothetical protein V6D48_02600 [Oculatellaceae cyanobacterium]